MTAEEYRSALHILIGQARVISMLPLDEILNAHSRMESFASILDPTLYRNKSQAASEDRELIHAAMPLWRYAKKMMETEKEQ